MIPTRRRYRRRTAFITSILGITLLYHFFSLHSDLEPGNVAGHASAAVARDKPYCPPLPGIEDVLVVMKTGVTEALDKVPVHFNTTLTCVPNYIIFSDFEESISGVRIHDAFRNMNSEVKRSIPDFDLYNRLVVQGRDGLKTQDFADEANSAIGKPNNPGWKLDKWKFLPMVQETLRHRDDAKWYVFVEADTYMVWPNLMAWLDKFDPEQPLYIGTETQIAETIFAHGGSGFIISNPAMKMAADAYETKTDELNAYTDGHWAGDCVLGKVLFDCGVPLHYSWPMLQNSNLGELDEFTEDFYRRPWCFPAVAFHHLTSQEIEGLWRYEQNRWKTSNNTLLLHSDVFKELIQPELSSPRNNWDNLSADEKPTISSFEECHSYCLNSASCVQFAFKEGKCFHSKTPRLGATTATGAKSGWMTGKIQNMVDAAGSCPEVDFGL